jgi:tRNA1(Val) A37 N6-methylase TrmN6
VTDVNPRALQVTKQTALHNCSSNNNELDYLEAIQCDLAVALLPRLAGQVDLAVALLPRLAGQVDVILFNPPYVPLGKWTPEEDAKRSLEKIGSQLLRWFPVERIDILVNDGSTVWILPMGRSWVNGHQKKTQS